MLCVWQMGKMTLPVSLFLKVGAVSVATCASVPASIDPVHNIVVLRRVVRNTLERTYQMQFRY